MSLNLSSLPLENIKLFVPPLEKVQKCLSKGLLENYRYVTVKVEQCPDFALPPFNLAAHGIGGNTKVLEFGDTSYLFPLPKKEKVYDLRRLPEILNMDPLLLIGAGLGASTFLGRACEGSYNMFLDGSFILQKSTICYMDENKQPASMVLPENETRCSMVGNFFVSSGQPGKIVKVEVSNRYGIYDFPSSIRNILVRAFKNEPIALGGLMCMQGGQFQHHIISDYSSTPLYTSAEIKKWMNYYDYSAPLIASGYLCTGPDDMMIRKQHFHSFPTDDAKGGHYLVDINGSEVKYCAYLNTAERYFKFDQPVERNESTTSFLDTADISSVN